MRGALIVLLCWMAAWPSLALERVVISEFMAANGRGPADEDGDFSDWIELHNIDRDSVNLAGWHLTDDRDNPGKWTFPSVTLAPGSFLVVFASGKDRATPRLHTNFQLERDGEYLALVGPDGLTIAHEYAPGFPPQESDISYGVTTRVDAVRFVTNGTAIKWLVPTAPFSPDWASTNFDDSAWVDGFLGAGFDAGSLFNPFILTDVGGAMRGTNASMFLRAAFTFDTEESEPLESLALRVRYDDGFVAFLNGQEVARRNAPVAAAWNSAATDEHPDASAVLEEDIEISSVLPLLQSGTNVLAVHALNVAANDEALLIAVELVAESPPVFTERYFSSPTPGSTNALAYLDRVADTKFSVDRGFYDEPFTVALINATSDAIIRYTLNGSTPGLTNGFVYSGPILINKTTTLRTASFKTGWQPSDVDTHTYIFINDAVRQSFASATNAGFPATWLTFPSDYEMDRDVVGPGDLFGGKYAATIRDDLKSIPSLSIVLSIGDLFGTNGIYSNAARNGVAWERAASVEVLYPDNTPAEHVDCGLRIHGNSSRSTTVKKQSLRLLFKERYGPPQWHYPVFGTYSNATAVFNSLILRGGNNDSWFGRGDSRGLYVRDAYAQETLLAMGSVASHHRFFHLYLNGLYWGLYEMVERPDEAFSAAYFGGEKEEWTSVQDQFSPSEDRAAWNAMLSLCRRGLTNNADYLRIQGLLPDGTPDPASTNHLDVENLIDYMIMHLYIADGEWPNINYWIGRRRVALFNGYKFYPWDAEASLARIYQVTANLTGANQGVAEPYAACRQNLEFRVLFGDHVQKHFFNGGAFYTDPVDPRWNAAQPERNVPAARFVQVCDSIQRALVGESARWGDMSSSVPFTRDEAWLVQKTSLLTSFFPQRSAIVLQQFRNAGLFPNIAAPIFNQPGGSVPAGFSLSMLNPNTSGGTLFYTLNGSDPRLFGGAVNPAAVAYFTPEILNGPIEVRARVRQGTNWSALARATFHPPQDVSRLLVTEVMYHPPAFVGVDGDEVEFLELKNAGTTALRLDGLRFVSGIDFVFTNGIALPPGEFFLLARNPGQFAARYPGIAIDGVYTGRLDNSGETLRLVHSLGSTLLSIAYNDRAPWPVSAGGFGSSIVPINPNANPNPDVAANWRASSQPGGSPGRDDLPSAIGPVLINEVLTASVFPERDAIELFNPQPGAADIGGWFLTDDPAVPKKFRIPVDTILPPGGFAVFDETQFNAVPSATNSFSLRAEGDEVYVLSADAAGNLTGYSHGFSFGAAARGATFGRLVKSTGEEELTAQAAPSLGGPNAGPQIGPVIINEIHYHPEVEGDEFIELKNIAGAPVQLFDPTTPAHTWRINGLGFTFPENVTLAANGLLVVVSTEPAAFRLKYAVPPTVPILGPYFGQLQDSGERLELQMPGPPDTNGSLAFIDVDAVRYNDRTPWPPVADGGGPSLQRTSPPDYGNEPLAWQAAAPTPGRHSADGPPPSITSQPTGVTILGTHDAILSVGATGTGPLFYQWSFNGNPIDNATNSTLLLTNVLTSQSGSYRVLVYNEAGFVVSDLATLTVLRAADIISPPTNVAVHIRPDPRAAPTTNATFRVVAASATPIRYQWRFLPASDFGTASNGTDIPGATNTSLVVSNVQLSHEGNYSVAVTDGNGTIFSSAYLCPLISPTFVVHPMSQSAAVGSMVTLSAAVSGNPGPFSFVWRPNSTPVITNTVTAYSDFFNFVTSNRPMTQIVAVVARNLANPLPGVISAQATIVTLPDQDGDGIPDEWENQFGLQPTNAIDKAFDADGDGMSNQEEYLAGTDPTNSLSFLRVELNSTNRQATVQFPAVSNKTYTVLFTDRASLDGWRKLADVLARTNNRMETLVDRNWTTNRFYRLATPRQPF